MFISHDKMQFVATFLLLALQHLDNHKSVLGKLDAVKELLNRKGTSTQQSKSPEWEPGRVLKGSVVP